MDNTGRLVRAVLVGNALVWMGFWVVSERAAASDVSTLGQHLRFIRISRAPHLTIDRGGAASKVTGSPSFIPVASDRSRPRLALGRNLLDSLRTTLV
jgi:hypothetical protein